MTDDRLGTGVGACVTVRVTLGLEMILREIRNGVQEQGVPLREQTHTPKTQLHFGSV